MPDVIRKPEEQSDDMDFELAFGSASGESAQAPPAQEGVEGATPDGEEGSTPADEGTPDEGTPGDGVPEGEPAGDEPPADDASKDADAGEQQQPPKATPDPELLDRIARLEQQLEQARKQEPPKKEEPKKEEPKKEEPKFSDDEQSAIEELTADWPTVDKAMAARLRLATEQITQQFEGKIDAAIKNMMQQLAPALQTVGTVATDKFTQDLANVHSDVQEIFPKVEEWVNKLPSVLKDAYNKIIDYGSAEEVADVITLYKKVHGVEGAPQQKQDSQEQKIQAPPEEKSPEVGRTKNKRLEQMAGVRREPTGVSAEVDTNDFEGAFERAASSQ